ncbi:HNH endonuclease [Dolichospermum sp. ST_sed7]|nr:HNH endonuclease [Dolichospermum sp. ST_sed7]
MNAEHKYKYSGLAGTVVETDKGMCIAYGCSSKNDLVVHHWNNNKDDNRIENLVTLCRSCHAKLHNQAKDFANKNVMFKGYIKMAGVYLFTLRDAISGQITSRQLAFNIIPTVARTMIANNLTDVTPDNVPYIKYAELGTSTQAPANGDTALIASSYRNAIASRTNAANIGYATAFFNATETSGSFKEAGIFCDGTASAGTGILLSRVAINITKTNTQTLTIDWTLTVT